MSHNEVDRACRWLDKHGYKTIWADAWGWFVWDGMTVTQHTDNEAIVAFAKFKGRK